MESNNSNRIDVFKDMSTSVDTFSFDSQTANEENFEIDNETIYDDYGNFYEMDFEQIEEDLYSNEYRQYRRVDFSIDSQTPIRRLQKSEIQSEYVDPLERMLEKLQEKIPSIENISLESLSTESISTDAESISDIQRFRRGAFVDPLTGQGSEDYKRIHDEEEEVEEDQIDFFEDDDTSLDEFSFPSYDEIFQQISTKIAETVKPHESALTFDELAVREVRVEPKTATTETETEIQISTEAYLNNLLNDVLENLYKRSKPTTLSFKLDKKALLKRLEEEYLSIMRERKINFFVVGKAITYYRRRGCKNCFIVQRPDTFPDEFLRYKRSCESLNKLLGKESCIAKKINLHIDELMKQYNYYEETKKKEINKFENLVRKALKYEPKSLLAKQIDLQLENIDQLRTEISEVRSDLIKTQHKLSVLKKKKNEVETISGSLSVPEYQILYDEVDVLNKQLEDREAMLVRKHKEFQKNIHIKGNLKIIKECTTRSNRWQRWKLIRREIEESECQMRVFESRLKLRRTRQKLSDLRFQSGMLDKPLLLHDFDRIMDLLKKKHQQIDEMRKVHKELFEKIEQQEKLISITDEKPKMFKNLKSSPKKSLKLEGFV